jgi:hypothetical protein
VASTRPTQLDLAAAGFTSQAEEYDRLFSAGSTGRMPEESGRTSDR